MLQTQRRRGVDSWQGASERLCIFAKGGWDGHGTGRASPRGREGGECLGGDPMVPSRQTLSGRSG